MRIAAYLAFKVVFFASISAILLVTVYVAVDFVEAASLLRTPMSKLILLYPSRLPMVLSYVLPLAMALGSQITVAFAKRNGEWDAMSSAGISNIRIYAALLTVPFIAVFFAAVNVEHLSPLTMKIWMGEEAGLNTDFEEPARWCKRNGTLFCREQDEKRKAEIIRENGKAKSFFLMNSENSAKRWVAGEGWHTASQKYDDIGCPESQAGIFRGSSTSLAGAAWTSAELTEALKDAKEQGRGKAHIQAELSLRTALEIACFAIPLLCLGLSARKRDIAISAHIGSAVFAAVAYWIFVAAAWNGAAAGAWSFLFVWAVVPGAYIVLGIALLAMPRRLSR